ncbi:hypothetical protein QM012_001445 [Aureobasidium pullulans]|uniref:F-box domain-containing protein n=1 Tax=Aureobasidium pullulans TaxID=5580 RepID=A0ABR0TFG4_AURPU
MPQAPNTTNSSTLTERPVHLPNEILQRLAQLADDEDLLALRATSRVFNDGIKI